METNTSATKALLEGHSVRSLVLRLGVPAMFGQFFNLLYSIVDRIFVGRLPQGGELALAGIGICAPALTAVTPSAGASWPSGRCPSSSRCWTTSSSFCSTSCCGSTAATGATP